MPALAVTTVKNVAAQVAWPVLEDLIRIADKANIPVCGAAVAILTYLIDTFNTVQGNKVAHVQLQKTLENYMKTLKDFVSTLASGDVSHSRTPDATIAREAIKTFDTNLQQVLALAQKQETQTKRGRLRQWIHRERIRGDIDECRKQLEQSHEAFQDAILNVTLGRVSRIPSGQGAIDEWKIAGAKPLPPRALGRMKPHRGALKPHWGDHEEFVQAEVDGVNRIVKLFRNERGEIACLNVLKFLQKYSGPCFQIYGYSAEANPPFIVFHSGELVSFDHFRWYSLLDKDTKYGHLIQIWECLVDLKEALEFIAKCHVDLIRSLTEEDARAWTIKVLEGTMVDEFRKIIMDIPDAISTVKCSIPLHKGDFRYNALDHLQSFLSFRLLELLTCGQLYLALWVQPEFVFNRTILEAARLDPYERVASLRGFRDPQLIRFSWRDARLRDVGLLDRKKAAMTKQSEFKKISVVGGVRLCCRVRQPFAEIFEVAQLSDGVYRFRISNSCLWHDNEMRWYSIECATELARTEDTMRLLARKARCLANEYAVTVEEIVFATQTRDFIQFNEVLPSLVSRLPEPMSFYLHLDEDPVRYYWSFSEMPLTPEGVMNERHIIDALGTPEVQFDHRVNCLQLSEWDVKEYCGGESDGGVGSMASRPKGSLQ